MPGPTHRVETAELEAAAWHSRLGETPVTTQMIEEFFAWRGQPGNADAYRRVEAAWAATGKLAGAPAAQDAVEAALSRKSGRYSRRRSLAVGIGGLAAAALLVVAVFTWVNERGDFVTQVGEQRLVQLADGSTVRLDTDSRIKVRFARDRRLVDLERGQAQFTVASDRKRPFVVVAEHTRVKAVGTVFDVRRGAQGVSVTLVEGVVEIEDSQAKTPPERLSAGQRNVRSGRVTRTQSVDIEAATSWTDGRITLQDVPLEDAVAEVNRYLTDKIILDAPGLRTVKVNGVFRTGDRDAFTSTAAQGLDLDVSPGVDGSVRLTERKNN